MDRQADSSPDNLNRRSAEAQDLVPALDPDTIPTLLPRPPKWPLGLAGAAPPPDHPDCLSLQQQAAPVPDNLDCRSVELRIQVRAFDPDTIPTLIP
jgi:hypothetical protein